MLMWFYIGCFWGLDTPTKRPRFESSIMPKLSLTPTNNYRTLTNKKTVMKRMIKSIPLELQYAQKAYKTERPMSVGCYFQSHRDNAHLHFQ